MDLLCNALIFSLCMIPSHQRQPHVQTKYLSINNTVHIPSRILEIMRSYCEEATVRITEMNSIRFMYEESPFYEQGYIMGEIIERYRKIVEHAKRPHLFKSDAMYETLRRLELTQKLYFEVYHLVKMMHEVVPKYKYEPEFYSVGGGVFGVNVSLEDIQTMQKQFEAMQQRREKEKRKRMKMNEKLRQLYMKGLSQAVYGAKKTPYNRWWPIDYGWEIDYRWM